jgi:hypothetical protein
LTMIKVPCPFINRCLRQILNIRWPNKITNENLWDKTKQTQMEIDIKKKKMGLDWAYTEKTTREYHKTIAQLEPTEDQKSWKTKADLEKKRGARSEDSRMDLGPDREDVPEQSRMAKCGCRPLLHGELQGINQVKISCQLRDCRS